MLSRNVIYKFHVFRAKFFTVWAPSGFFQFFILRVLCRRSTGTACLIVPLVSFARLTLPIMRDNTGNRLSRYPITGPDHCTFTESVLSQIARSNVYAYRCLAVCPPFNAVMSNKRHGYLDSRGMCSPKTDCSKAWLSILSLRTHLRKGKIWDIFSVVLLKIFFSLR